MIKGLVRKIIKFSAVDGPGNRSAVFLQGCNMSCSYCHNPETIPMAAHEAVFMTAHEVFAEIGGAVNYVRGITVSGGECTLQRNFVIELIREAKSKGLTSFIDTNGIYPFYADLELLEYTDGVMLDVKSASDSEHKRITGLSNKRVIRNLEFLAQNDKLYEVRTVLSEDILDCSYTVDFVSRVIGQYQNINYKLIKYRPMGVRKETARNITTPNADLMELMHDICLRNNVHNVVLV